ncbi:hypothetical protein TcasGA2_TC034954 [Tribolium castaneum]|uniref:Uncharacterized protein n=1 Tax=Tribolium castaneum TaxID=7070 RepID=A0A139W9V0_TRICA|nr:hypothetical protein TcasGA2_TC034954 [Tribolium castaneum]
MQSCDSFSPKFYTQPTNGRYSCRKKGQGCRLQFFGTFWLGNAKQFRFVLHIKKKSEIKKLRVHPHHITNTNSKAQA